MYFRFVIDPDPLILSLFLLKDLLLKFQQQVRILNHIYMYDCRVREGVVVSGIDSDQSFCLISFFPSTVYHM